MAKKKTDLPAREQLREWRGKRSKLEVSRLLGMHPALVSKIESGEYIPGKKIALRIQAATEIECTMWWPPEAQTAA